MTIDFNKFEISSEAVVAVRQCNIIAYKIRQNSFVDMTKSNSEDTILKYLLKPETFFVFDEKRLNEACSIIKSNNMYGKEVKIDYKITDEISPLGFEKWAKFNVDFQNGKDDFEFYFDGVLLYSILSKDMSPDSFIEDITVTSSDVFDIRKLPYLDSRDNLEKFVIVSNVEGYFGKIATIKDLKAIETTHGKLEIAVVKDILDPTIIAGRAINSNHYLITLYADKQNSDFTKGLSIISNSIFLRILADLIFQEYSIIEEILLKTTSNYRELIEEDSGWSFTKAFLKFFGFNYKTTNYISSGIWEKFRENNVKVLNSLLNLSYLSPIVNILDKYYQENQLRYYDASVNSTVIGGLFFDSDPIDANSDEISLIYRSLSEQIAKIVDIKDKISKYHELYEYFTNHIRENSSHATYLIVVRFTIIVFLLTLMGLFI